MKIILKHIVRNIKEKKIRSILIILSLIISTTALILNLTFRDEILVKFEDTLKGIYGETEIGITKQNQKDPTFKISEINLDNYDVDYVEYMRETLTLNHQSSNEEVFIYGFDLKKAIELKLLNGLDYKTINKNGLLINEKTATKYGYKKGDMIELRTKDNKVYEIEIAGIASNNGILTNINKTDMTIFVGNIDTVNNMLGLDTDIITGLFIDSKDVEIDEFKDELENLNQDYKIEKLVDLDHIEEGISAVSQLLFLVFVIVVLMIIYLISSLTKLTLEERMPVIGTFRSVGATKGKMNFILVLENALYGLIGGSFGIALGYLLKNNVGNIFINSNIELSEQGSGLDIKYIIIALLFAVSLQVVMSLLTIIKNNKRPIKDVIFNTQDTKVKLSKRKIISGLVLIAVGIILNIMNTTSDFMIGLISFVGIIVGLAFEIPAILNLFSTGLTKVTKKLEWPISTMAFKNIANNKMVVSSATLITVTLSLLLMLFITISSISNFFDKAKTAWFYDIQIMNLLKTEEHYDYIKDIEGIDETYAAYIASPSVKINKLETLFAFVGYNEKERIFEYIGGLEADKEVLNNLAYNEIVIDSFFAKKRNINKGDYITIEGPSFKDESFKLKVVDFFNSTMFSSSRTVAIVNIELYKEKMTDIPTWILVKTDDGQNKILNRLTDEIKESGVILQTFKEYVEAQEENTNGTISFIGLILSLGVALSFIGIMNNEIIGFMQRKRSLAVLYSTCMSKVQLKKLLILEVIYSFIISCILSILISVMLTSLFQKILEGMFLCIPLTYELTDIFKVVMIIFIILLLTVIVPIRRLKKLGVVKAIKYE